MDFEFAERADEQPRRRLLTGLSDDPHRGLSPVRLSSLAPRPQLHGHELLGRTSSSSHLAAVYTHTICDLDIRGKGK